MSIDADSVHAFTPTDSPDVPRSSLLDRLKRLLLPGNGAATRRDIYKDYRSAKSFTDLLPWAEYLPHNRQFLFEDGLTRMAIYEVDPIPTEGRSQENLVEAMQSLTQLFSDTFPEHQRDPWVVQIYASSEPDISAHMERLRHYINERARGTEFTENFLKIYEQHLGDVSRNEGYFYDDRVTDSVWRGQSFKIRIVCYRRYWDTQPAEEPSLELDQVCAKLETNLDALGVGVSRIDGKGFYEWMLGWFNPRPAMCEGNPAKLKDYAPYPGDEDVPIGRDFAEMVTLSRPRCDQAKKLWYFDDMPHTVLEVLAFNAKPKRGQLSGELPFAGKHFSIVDRLPEGSVIAMTTTILPQDMIHNQITMIRDKAVSGMSESELARDEAELVLARMATGDKLYPCEVAFYLRAENELELLRSVNTTQSVLSQNSIRTIAPAMDAIQVSHFKRNLPGVYVPAADRVASRRARLMFIQDQASIAPVYGRGRGSNNPGLLFFNRFAEPFSFDPLNMADRMKNGHLFVVGPPGAGKSATLGWMLDTVTAVHRPRIFIIDVGNSFGLQGEYFAKHGLTVNSLRLSSDSPLSIPPFADTIKLADKQDEISPGDFESLEEEVEEDLREFADGEDVARDLIGEAEIIARLMITGGEEKEEQKMSRQKRTIIRKAILLAANNVHSGKSANRTVLTEDVEQALRELASSHEYTEIRRDLVEMADAIAMFTSGLNGHLFNREGELWVDADVTIVDLAEAASTGKEDTLAVAYVSLMQHIQQLVERKQFESRPTIVLTDEGHIITTNPLLAPYIIKITKMWRKLGTWFWLATQNLQDFPASATRMLNMMEFWLCLSLPKDEIEQASRFKELTDEQKGMMAQCVKYPGKYVEAVVLCDKFKSLVRVVAPPIALALSFTEKEEKVERQKLIDEQGLTSHADAAELVAERIRNERLAFTGRERH